MDQITKYFNGEKLQCTIGLVISLIVVSVCIYFFLQQKPLLKGIAFSSLPISFFLFIICIAVIIRSPKDIERVTTFQKENPEMMQNEELPRMEKVMRNFSVVKKVELGLFIIGILLVIILRNNELVKGIGIGLIVQGVIMYCFDWAAESRGELYMDFLKSF